MAKKKAGRRKGGKPQPRSTVPVGGVLADVIDELASLAEILRAVPRTSQTEPDEIAEWAKILNVKLDAACPPSPDQNVNNAPATLAHNAVWRLCRLGRLLEALQGRLPANAF